MSLEKKFTYPEKETELTNSELQKTKYEEVYLGKEGKYFLKNINGKSLQMIAHNNSKGSFYVKCPDGYNFELKVKDKIVYEINYQDMKKSSYFTISGNYIIYNKDKSLTVKSQQYEETEQKESVELKTKFEKGFTNFLKKQNLPELKKYEDLKGISTLEDLINIMANTKERSAYLELFLGKFFLNSIEEFETDSFQELTIETKEQILGGFLTSEKRKDGDLEKIYYFGKDFMDNNRLINILSKYRFGNKDDIFYTEILGEASSNLNKIIIQREYNKEIQNNLTENELSDLRENIENN